MRPVLVFIEIIDKLGQMLNCPLAHFIAWEWLPFVASKKNSLFFLRDFPIMVYLHHIIPDTVMHR
jgi:hypothetical protein